MSLGLQNVVSFPWDYFRGLRAVAESAQPIDEASELDQRCVVFDFRTSRMLFDAGRYFYVLAEAFRQAGIEIQVVKNRWFLARAGRKYWGRAALSLPNLEAEWLQGSHGSPVGRLSDQDSSHTRLMFGDTHSEGADIFPYPMHPRSYASASLDELRCKRTSSLQPRIFFSGNVNHKYDNRILESKFGVVSRGKLIAALRKELSAKLLPQQEEYSALLALLDAPNVPDLIINDRKQCPIPGERWLETLSRFDFFLCCPGVSHPYCHNAIEAMSVGTIPIIEFPGLFSPPLNDGVNAVTFRGLHGLTEAVDRALHLSTEHRKSMSQAVIRYYQDHLCIRHFVERWLQRGANSPIHFPYIPATC